MRSRDRRRALAALMGAAAVIGLAASPDVEAAPAAPLGEDLFGSYALEARGQGVQARYEIEGLLPGGTPVLDLGLPETLARFSSGPTGYGVASLAYPGGVIVNLPALVEQSGGGSTTPPYPIKEEAFFPAGPTEAGAEQPGGIAQRVVTSERGVEARAAFPALTAAPAVSIGTTRTSARTALEGEAVVSRVRVVTEDVVVLGGVLSFDSIVTDLVAAHEGDRGSTAGGTTVQGARFLGLAAELTPDGLVLSEAPAASGPGAPVGELLGPLAPPLGQALSPVQQALADALDGAQPQLDDLLATAGVHLRLAPAATPATTTGAAVRDAAGLVIELRYAGREQQALGDLLAAIPDELKPNVGPVPNPVAFLAENHLGALALAPASVSALATPPFPVDDLPPAAPAEVPTAAPSALSDPAPDPGFTTPLPAVPAAARPVAPTAVVPAGAATPLGGAVPALLVALALLASPGLGVASGRAAERALTATDTRCPTGHDQPPAGRPE